MFSTNKISLEFLVELVKGPYPPPILTHSVKTADIINAFDSIGNISGWVNIKETRDNECVIAVRLIGDGDYIITYKEYGKDERKFLLIINIERYFLIRNIPPKL
jgi:hypothetical protein